jgi:hypothetical protein
MRSKIEVKVIPVRQTEFKSWNIGFSKKSSFVSLQWYTSHINQNKLHDTRKRKFPTLYDSKSASTGCDRQQIIRAMFQRQLHRIIKEATDANKKWIRQDTNQQRKNFRSRF